MPESSARIEKGVVRVGRAGALLRFPFDQRTVDELKYAVEPRDRTYDPETTTWWVAESALERAIAVLRQRWSEIMVFSPEGDYVLGRDGTVARQESLF